MMNWLHGIELNHLKSLITFDWVQYAMTSQLAMVTSRFDFLEKCIYAFVDIRQVALKPSNKLEHIFVDLRGKRSMPIKSDNFV